MQNRMRLIMLTLSIALASTAAAEEQPDLHEKYGKTVDRILETTLAGNGAWDKLVELCDDIGHRLSGSPELEKAVAWAAATLKRDGHENVRTEKVMVPKWVRGEESLELVKPRGMTLDMLGLGLSVGTDSRGIEAEVVVVDDERGLKRLGKAVAGKIVLFNNAMEQYDAQKAGAGYGHHVRFRSRGPSMAAELGAVAVLVRSVTAYSLNTPHTGATSYKDGIKKIPAAAVTIEGATLIERFTRRGKKVVVKLKMAAKHHGLAPSANVIAELVGTEKPEEVVVIGGHIDSWDAGTGAHDDGSGCVMAMEALTVLRKLGLRPRRTIRVVLFTNEENGLEGAKAYAKDHAKELASHAAAIEADSGCFQPKGFGLTINDAEKAEAGAKQLQEILWMLKPVGATHGKVGWAGADLLPMADAGVPRLGLRMDNSTYFNYHHTPADTVDKVNPEHLSKNVASMAALAFVLADMPGRLGDLPPKDKQH